MRGRGLAYPSGIIGREADAPLARKRSTPMERKLAPDTYGQLEGPAP